MRAETRLLLDQAIGALTQATAMVREDTNEVVSSQDHIAVIKHFNSVRVTMEQIKEAREALDEMRERLSSEQVPDVMRLAGVKTITVEMVGRVTVSNRYAASIIEKEDGFKWLRDNGHGGLISETVNSSSLAAFAKSYAEELGRDLPPDIFKVGLKPYTSITKA